MELLSPRRVTRHRRRATPDTLRRRNEERCRPLVGPFLATWRVEGRAHAAAIERFLDVDARAGILAPA